MSGSNLTEGIVWFSSWLLLH